MIYHVPAIYRMEHCSWTLGHTILDFVHKGFVTHRSFAAPALTQGVAATKWRAIPSSAKSSKAISAFASLHSFLA